MWTAAQEKLEKWRAQFAADEGQLIETDAALRELRGEKMKTVSQFIADNENKNADASRKADEPRQSLAGAAARLAARAFMRRPTELSGRRPSPRLVARVIQNEG